MNDVKQLIQMGFAAEQSRKAVKSANGNLSIAIEFLYNDIPSNTNDFEYQNDDIPYVGENQESDSSTILKNKLRWSKL